jgi:hypothetical protein
MPELMIGQKRPLSELDNDMIASETPLGAYETPIMPERVVSCPSAPKLLRPLKKQVINDDMSGIANRYDVFINDTHRVEEILFDETKMPVDEESVIRWLAPFYKVIGHASATTRTILKNFLTRGIITRYTVESATEHAEKIIKYIDQSQFGISEYIGFTNAIALGTIFLAHKMMEDKPFSNKVWYNMMCREANKMYSRNENHPYNVVSLDLQWDFYETFVNYEEVNYLEYTLLVGELRASDIINNAQ